MSESGAGEPATLTQLDASHAVVLQAASKHAEQGEAEPQEVWRRVFLWASAAVSLEHLRVLRVTHVLSVAAEEPPRFEDQSRFKYRWDPLVEATCALTDTVAGGMDFIGAALSESPEHRVLIHCLHGKTQTVLLACCGATVAALPPPTTFRSSHELVQSRMPVCRIPDAWFDELEEFYMNLLEATPGCVVLICGPSGCGKSTLALALAAAAAPLPAAVVGQDAYFARPFAPYSCRVDDSFEGPEHVDWERLRLAVSEHAKSHRLVAVEGHIVAADAALVAMADLCVILECSHDVCRQRRVNRRERKPEEKLELSKYFDDFVWPAFLKYGLPALGSLQRSCDASGTPVVKLDVAGSRPTQQLVHEILKAGHGLPGGTA